MRYIIIPIVIILYIYWSYRAIDDLIDCYKNPYLDGTDAEDYTYGWLLTHLSILFGKFLIDNNANRDIKDNNGKSYFSLLFGVDNNYK